MRTTAEIPARAAEPATIAIPRAPFFERARGWGIWLAIAALLAWSWTPVEMYKIGGLITDWRNMAEFASGFMRPSLRDWPSYAEQMLETVQMALWGTALAVIFGMPFAILSAANVCPQWIVQPERPRSTKRIAPQWLSSYAIASAPAQPWLVSFTTKTSSARSRIVRSMSTVSELERRAVAGTRIFENASIVLPAAVMLGWIAVSSDRIIEVGEGRAPERGLDCAGDLLVPGLIDLHTDHLESHLLPRPKVAWPPLAAVVAYDAQIAASAITTVFDCVRVGSDLAYPSVAADLTAILAAIEAARAQDLLRAEHRLHVRCEICAEDVVEQTGWLLAGSDAKLMSLMDHTPGARQFCDLGAWKTYYGGKSGLPASELERFMQARRTQFAANYVRHRAALVALAKAYRIVTASHDDATLAHVPPRRQSPMVWRLPNSRPRPKPPRPAMTPASPY